MTRILYVDDSAEPLQKVKAELPQYAAMRRDQPLEIDTIHTPSPMKALEAAKAGKPYDLIMLDYRFDVAGQNGVDIAREIRSAGITTPIVIYSSDPREKIVEESPDLVKLHLTYCDKQWNTGKLYEVLRLNLQPRRQAV